ncbi:pantoate--beta-alanine ligase [Sodalis-like secondary symbiont of Drepanosiphum platanoidis]|uniref:pantoate--beta-alanine ligase n=1 Tax=Sodalis-like secondary symbiont of Drepanosiphum platanoidis TaxID=2994493 RepID=UPI0034639F8B
MYIIRDPKILYNKVKKIHKKNNTIALIPTMGNLHLGHIKLIEVGQKNADKVIVSIFVNPMQFKNLNDSKKYPRSLKEDFKKLKLNNVDIVFCPRLKKMYLNNFIDQIFVNIPSSYNILESKNRPYHFKGVMTIVSKLFNIISPEIACFGKKDFQQLFFIKKLVIQMNYNIQILGVPIVRDNDGLALSSRNILLNSKERKIAPEIYKTIKWISKKINKNNLKNNNFLKKAYKNLVKHGFKIDILTIRDSKTLNKKLTKKTSSIIILCSAWIGKVRLIDNLEMLLKN